jgi:DNA-binding CsgD family transcriptional regulator
MKSDYINIRNLCDAEKSSVVSLFIGSVFDENLLSETDDDEIKYFVKVLELTSKICNTSIYVIDFRKECFHFVSEHDLFLSGFSSGDILKIGYVFFRKVIHPDDIQLFINTHRIVSQYLFDPNCNQEEIDHFAFNFRLINNKFPLMVHIKLIPIFINGHIRIAVCQLSNSVIKFSGNLIVYNKDEKMYSSYSFEKRIWLQKELLRLTKREKEIITLSQQGKSSKEIADILNIASKTVWNIETNLYRKLNVHSMMETVSYITNHQVMFSKDFSPKEKGIRGNCLL